MEKVGYEGFIIKRMQMFFHIQKKGIKMFQNFMICISGTAFASLKFYIDHSKRTQALYNIIFPSITLSFLNLKLCIYQCAINMKLK